MKGFAVVLLTACRSGAVVDVAHVTMSPLIEKPALATQKYELRVHNEAKVAATSVDLDIPDGEALTDAKPATGL